MDGKTLVFLFLGTFAFLMTYVIVRGVRRRRGVKEAAARLGLRHVSHDEALEKRLLGKLPMFDHEDISVSDVFTATHKGAPYYIFDLAYYHRNNLRGRRDRERVGTVACFELRGADLPPFRLWPRGKRRGERGNGALGSHPELAKHFELSADGGEPFNAAFAESLLRTKHQSWGVEAKGDWLAVSRYFSRDEERVVGPDDFAAYHDQVLALKDRLHDR